MILQSLRTRSWGIPGIAPRSAPSCRELSQRQVPFVKFLCLGSLEAQPQSAEYEVGGCRIGRALHALVRSEAIDDFVERHDRR